MVRLVRIILAVAAFLAVSCHVIASWTLLHRMVWREDTVRRPWRMLAGTPFLRDVGPDAAVAGLRSGDEVVSVGGMQHEGLNDYALTLAKHAAGKQLAVEWLLLVSFLTPVACLVVGFGVAYIRPRFFREWIV